MSAALLIHAPGARRALAGLALTLAVCAPAARSDVLDVGPGGDFPNVLLAVAAAVDGDVIVVAPGSYAGFDIDDKELTLVGDGAVVFSSQVRVRNLAAGKLVVLQNFSNPTSTFEPAGVEVIDCAGHVLLDSVQLYARDGYLEAHPALSVRFSDAVTLSNSSFFGGNGAFCNEDFCTGFEDLGRAGAGVAVRSSNVAIENCALVGGHGGSWDFSEPVNGGSGGAAVHVLGQGSVVSVLRSTLQGGDGGFGDCDTFNCGVNGSGGPALFLTDESGFVRVRDDALLPGAAAGSGTLASEVQVIGGGLVDLSATTAAGLVASSPVRSGDSGALTLHAEPGTSALVLLSLSAGWFHVPGREGVLELGLPFALNQPLMLGVVPGSGSLTLNYTAPDLSGFPALELHAQAVTLSPGGARLDGSAVIVLIDETP